MVVCSRMGHSGSMDGVLASMITSVVTVIVTGGVTSGVAVWSARQSAKLARETRTQQRLAESYLEVLRIVKREGQWIEAITTNREIDTAEEAQWDPVMLAERVKLPEPVVTDRAVIAAHLAALFSSPRNQTACWTSGVKTAAPLGDMNLFRSVMPPVDNVNL
jgi:hypothetical protein